MGNANTRASYWPVLLARAAVAAIAALVVTFSADHSPALGLAVFGGFAIASGVLLTAFVRRSGLSPRGTLLVALQGAACILGGVLSLLLLTQAPALTALVVLVVLWAGVSGALEIATGLRRGDGPSLSRDRVVLGSFTVLLAVAVLLGREDAVFVVGSVGAYAAVSAVYGAIASFTLKWDVAQSESRSAVRS